jgi:hypothetical protein
MDIDSIDITDSAFSLDVPEINSIVGGAERTDYTMFIYIGIAVILIAVGVFIYKIYLNKKATQMSEDCPGGFCTMNEQPDRNHNNSYNQHI